MKKTVSLLTAIVLLVLVFAGMPSASALNISTGEGLSIYTITEPYEYPIKQGSEEWLELSSFPERAAAYAVPSEVIQIMTTEALMLTVMSNPYFINIRAFDSTEMGIEVVSSYVSGLAELCSRLDFADAMQNISQQQFALYYAGANTDIDTQFSLEMKLLSSIYLVISGEGNQAISLLGTPSQVATPNTPAEEGVPVTLNMTYSDHQITIAEARAEQAGLLANHPSATVIVDITEATAAYNCHSYAWYSRKLNNNVWMENPTLYRTDGSYIATTRANAEIVYWYFRDSASPRHSGVMITPGSTNDTSIVISKWGYMGVIRHEEGDCPYSESGTVRTYWKRNS